MNLYQLNEAQAVATLRTQLALRDVHRHDVTRMLEAIPQHPAAIIGSAADDCRVGMQTCRLCGRCIINDGGRWIDPEATGDDIEWADVCDASETFTAEHEPDELT